MEKLNNRGLLKALSIMNANSYDIPSIFSAANTDATGVTFDYDFSNTVSEFGIVTNKANPSETNYPIDGGSFSNALTALNPRPFIILSNKLIYVLIQNISSNSKCIINPFFGEFHYKMYQEINNADIVIETVSNSFHTYHFIDYMPIIGVAGSSSGDTYYRSFIKPLPYINAGNQQIFKYNPIYDESDEVYYMFIVNAYCDENKTNNVSNPIYGSCNIFISTVESDTNIQFLRPANMLGNPTNYVDIMTKKVVTSSTANGGYTTENCNIRENTECQKVLQNLITGSQQRKHT